MSKSMMKGAMRSTKNLLYGYSDVQIRIRDATSNEPTGPTMSQMESLSSVTNSHGMMNDMIYIMDKRLNDHGKNWRHVYKTLILLEYMICCGSESVVNYARDRLYMIKTLKQFIHIDAHGYDQGAGVRAKARDVMELLEDEEMLAEARRTRSIPQNRRRASQEPLTLQPTTRNVVAPASHRASYDDLQNMDDDAALAQALRESKELHDKETRRKSLDSSQVYPNFLDNVSRASLAKSSSSINNNIAGVVNQEKSRDTVVSLLDLDDEDFGHGDRQRSQSMASMAQQDLSALYSLNLGGNVAVQNGTANPFQQEFGSHPQVEADPFGSSPFESNAGQRHISLPMMSQPMAAPQLSVPMPYMPGQAPVNHMSVGDNNIGAKPARPHQMAPQFGYTQNEPPANTTQGTARDDEDPFSRL